jgi:hypothetical protein
VRPHEHRLIHVGGVHRVRAAKPETALVLRILSWWRPASAWVARLRFRHEVPSVGWHMDWVGNHASRPQWAGFCL